MSNSELSCVRQVFSLSIYTTCLFQLGKHLTNPLVRIKPTHPYFAPGQFKRVKTYNINISKKKNGDGHVVHYSFPFSSLKWAEPSRLNVCCITGMMAFSLYVIFFTACLLVTRAAGSLNLMCIAYLHLHTRQSKYGCKKQHYFAVLLVSHGPPTDLWRLARLSDAGC